MRKNVSSLSHLVFECLGHSGFEGAGLLEPDELLSALEDPPLADDVEAGEGHLALVDQQDGRQLLRALTLVRLPLVPPVGQREQRQDPEQDPKKETKSFIEIEELICFCVPLALKNDFCQCQALSRLFAPKDS